MSESTILSSGQQVKINDLHRKRHDALEDALLRHNDAVTRIEDEHNRAAEDLIRSLGLYNPEPPAIGDTVIIMAGRDAGVTGIFRVEHSNLHLWEIEGHDRMYTAPPHYVCKLREQVVQA